MKVVTKTVLIIDREKPQIPAGKEVDLPKKIADDLVSRGLVELPEAKGKLDKVGGDDSQNDSAVEDDIIEPTGGDK